jgi:uncharacterized protein (DUF2141 family)
MQLDTMCKLRSLKFVWWLIVVAMLVRANVCIAGSAGGVEADIENVRNNRGQVICTLFTSPEGFPDHSSSEVTIAVPIESSHATCRFTNVPYGNYAIVAFHDENRDGKFNQNWLGLPLEGFGFSNNPSSLKKPSFEDARFTVEKREVRLTIKLNYWL